MQHVLSFLDYGANGYATGFVVGDRLVMTAYHVVSGQLSPSKKTQLGFGAKDELEVKAYVNGCQAAVVRVDDDTMHATVAAVYSIVATTCEGPHFRRGEHEGGYIFGFRREPEVGWRFNRMPVISENARNPLFRSS